MKEYDLIFSQGANCSVAHNLRYRGIRKYSLPFDWCYIEDKIALQKLIEGFKNNFSDFCKKENMLKVQGNLHHNVIFKDEYSGYFFPNHFEQENLDLIAYNKFKQKFDRRINRLQDILKQSKKVLFVFASDIKVSQEIFIELKNTVEALYPNLKLDMEVLLFEQDCNESFGIENINFNFYKREINLYDMQKTNFEWAFLDDLKLNKYIRNTKFKSVQRIKKGIKVHILPKFSTLLILKLYILGIRVYLIVGKDKKE